MNGKRRHGERPPVHETADKTALRARFRVLRQERLGVLQDKLNQSGPALLAAMPARCLDSGHRIGLTWPLPGEPDLRGWLRSTGRPLALPAATADGLLYRPWSADARLIPDACGIPAPPPEAGVLQPQALAVLLLPALALDRQGFRLGSGGGWYDRLRAADAWRAVPAAAVLPAACVVDCLPRDPWDVPLDGWLDETGWHWLDDRPAAVAS